LPAIQLAYCALVSALLSISYRLSRDSHFYHLAAAATPESRAAFEDHTEERVAGVAGDALLDNIVDDERQRGHDRSMKRAVKKWIFVAAAIASVCVMAWNFVGYKFWVFKK